MSQRKRVVITGMGWITPLGHDLQSVWAKLMAGASGVDDIRRFDASRFTTSFAAQVKDYEFRNYVDDPSIHENANVNTQFALGAARQAWDQSGLGAVDGIDPRRIGIYLGAGEGVIDFENYMRSNLAGWNPQDGELDAVKWVEAARQYLRPLYEVEQEPNMPVSHIAREFGLRGPAYNCLTACAASTQAIGEAYSIIQRGDADVMVSGGTHTMIHELGVTGFIRLTALSSRRDSPQTASRPFSRTRDGFVMGEGSGVVILETLEHAEQRGAVPIVEVIGYGSTADAFRITDMHPEGRGPAEAISLALAQAGIDAAAVDEQGRPPVHYISAHGTGTQENDSIETKAVKRVFGELAPSIPISSIKSMMGHLIAAAGVVELIACVLAIQHQKLPPTINLIDRDPELDLDYLPNEPRDAHVDTCLSNSFGFGGQNDTLIIRRLP
jgi:3-oxoacyl-[acyl-carrier-protein] synthase II